MGELAADGGADLRDLLYRRQPVEAGHQRILQRRGYRQRWQRPVQLEAIAAVDQHAALQHRLGQLLDEQRHAIGLGDDLLEHLVGKRLLLGHGGHHHRALAPSEPVECQRAGMGVVAPGRLEFGPCRYQHQHRRRFGSVDHARQQAERARIGPLRVFEHQQNRHHLGLQRHRFEQQIRGPVALLLRRQLERRIAAGEGDRQQRGDQGNDLGLAITEMSELALELIEPFRGLVVARDPRFALEALDHRGVGGVDMIGRALIAQQCIVLAARRLDHRFDEARFADAGLAAQHHHLAFAVGGLAPAA